MIAWTIDGSPVRVRDWTCSMTANGGHDQMRGTVLARSLYASQGSVVSAYRTDGSVLWQGRLSQDPDTHRGEADIAAQGYRYLVEKDTRPMLYQDVGFDNAAPQDSDPHNYSANENYNINLAPGRMRVRVEADHDLPSAARQNGVVWWYEGSDITRFKFRYSPMKGTGTSYDWRLQRGFGPSGSLQTIASGTATLSGAEESTTSIDRTVGATADLIQLRIENNSTPGATTRVWRFDQVKIWGRTTADEFTAGEVANDVAGVVGYDTTLVQTGDTNVLPLYWDSGSLGELLTYVADLADARWLVVGENPNDPRGPQLDFGPWSRLWRGSLERGITGADFTRLEVFNRVRVGFDYVSGATGTVEVEADPDPLGGRYVNTYDFELADPQPDDQLANLVASRLLDYHSAPQIRARLTIHEVQDSHGAWRSGYDLQAGDLLHVLDYDESVGPQRVMAVTYTPTETSVEITTDLNPGRILAEAQKETTRKRKRKRKRRR